MANPLQELISSGYLRAKAMQGAPLRPKDSGKKTKAQTIADLMSGTALATTFMPGVGDVAGMAADAAMYSAYPEQRNMLNYGLTALSALPFVPAVSAMRSAKKASGVIDAAGDAADAAKNLDMSTAARMQRAAEQGKTVDVYHGTNADYSSFDPSRLDIGLHVGTPEQAANRLRDTANPLIGGRSSYYASGANILPLKANLGNSLVMPDVGDWGDSLQVMEELKNVKGFDSRQIQELIDDAEQAMSSSSIKGMAWTETPENKSFLNEIRDIIKNKGYDSIKYQNAVENDYYDLADITDEAKNIKRELGYGLDYFEQKVRGRMPQVPDPQAPDAQERLQEFISAKFDDYILPEEAQAMESLKAQMKEIDNNPRYLKDNNSYIILDPAQNVSSRFAAFDPSKRGSGNILAGVGGAAIVGGSALNAKNRNERKPD